MSRLLGRVVAVRDIVARSPVRKYGQPIGVATTATDADELATNSDVYRRMPEDMDIDWQLGAMR